MIQLYNVQKSKAESHAYKKRLFIVPELLSYFGTQLYNLWNAVNLEPANHNDCGMLYFAFLFLCARVQPSAILTDFLCKFLVIMIPSILDLKRLRLWQIAQRIYNAIPANQKGLDDVKNALNVSLGIQSLATQRTTYVIQRAFIGDGI